MNSQTVSPVRSVPIACRAQTTSNPVCRPLEHTLDHRLYVCFDYTCKLSSRIPQRIWEARAPWMHKIVALTTVSGTRWTESERGGGGWPHGLLLADGEVAAGQSQQTPGHRPVTEICQTCRRQEAGAAAGYPTFASSCFSSD